VLWKAYGNQGFSQEEFRPTDLHVPKWTTDPRFCGSYSFFPSGALKNGDDFDNFFAPIKVGEKPVIYYAGEAFDKDYSAFTHGALISGEDVAN
jgi:hypothetical protein